MTAPNFAAMKAGDRVIYRRYNGLGRNGPEYRTAVSTVNRYLTFDTHVVVGGGTGTVVNDSNFLAHVPKGARPTPAAAALLAKIGSPA